MVDCSQGVRVTVRLVPNGSTHAGNDGSFELINLPTDQRVVFIEEAASTLFVEQQDEVEIYRRIASRLLDVALDKDESVDRIAELAKRFGKEEGA